MGDIVQFLNNQEPEKKPGGIVDFVNQQDQLPNTISQGLSTPPDTAARVLAMQYKTGLPQGVIERNLDEIERKANIHGFDAEKFRRESPLLADWMAKNPNHVAVAQNDTEALSGIEKSWEIVKNQGKAFAAAWPRMSSGMLGIAGEALDISGLGETKAGKWIWKEAAATAKLAESLHEGEKDWLSRAIGSGMESVGTTLLTWPFGMVGRAGATLGMIGAQTAGTSFQQGKEAGIDPYANLVFGMSQGLIEAATEQISLGRFLKDLNVGAPFWKILRNQILTENAGEQIATLAQDLNEWAVLNPDKPFSAYLEERPSAAAATFIATAVGVGLQTGVLHSAYKLAERKHNVESAKLREAFLRTMGENLSNSGIAAKSPEAVRSYMEHLKKDSGIDNIYVDVNSWDKLFQQDARRMAKEVLGNDTQYTEAKAIGGDIVIPIEAYAEKIASTPLHEQFMPDLKLGAGELSMREAEVVDKGFEKALTEEAKKIEEGIKQEAPIQKIYEDVVGQMIGIGATRQEAERIATLESQRQYARAAGLGIDPWELWQERKKSFQREMPEILKRKQVDMTIDPLLDALRSGKTSKTENQDLINRQLDELDKYLSSIGADLSKMNNDEVRKLIKEKEFSIIERYQWMRNKEGGQEFGNQQQIVPLNEVLYNEHVKNRVGGLDFSSYRVQHPDVTHISFVSRDRGRSWNVSNIGSAEELRPAHPKWAKQVESFDSTEAIDQGETADISDRALYQKDQTRTPEFLKWFGDSKVVDEDGKPLVVYHGTSADIETFKKSHRKRGNAFDRDSDAGFFFTSDTKQADYFAFIKGEEKVKAFGAPQDSNIIPVFLSIKNPLEVDGGGEFKKPDQIIKWAAQAKQEKRDGIIISNVYDAPVGGTTTLYIAFEPTKIKSAIGNIGTFDPTNPNILYQEESPLGMYDRLTNTITLLKKANPSTVLHELAHSWLEELKIDAARPNAPQQLIDDWNTIKEWAGITGDVIPVEAHEKFAQGVEKYFMEGKSPSVELQGVFARFKAWLSWIYRKIGLSVELTDETRAVFDRMLATEDQIARVREVQGYQKQLLGTEDMTSAEYAAYQKINEKAKTDAENAVRIKALSELTREQAEWWKKERANMREEVAKEIDAMPVYRAISWLRKGVFPDGSKIEGMEAMKLSKSALVQRYGEAFLQRLPRPYIYQIDGGLHPDVAAELFGFSNGEELVKALAESKPRSQLIDAETDARMKDKYGDMMTDGSLADEAEKEVNDRQAEVFMYELKILKRKGSTRNISPVEVFKSIARSVIQDKKVGELDPRYYERAARKAGEEAEKALLGKDMKMGTARNIDVAFDAKQRQLLNMYLYREAMKQKEAFDKGMDGFKALFKRDENIAKRRNMDMVNAARAIAAQHGIGGTEQTANAYLEQMRQYDPVTYEDMKDIVDMVTSDAKPFKQLTVSEFSIVKEAIDGLWELSLRTNQIEIEGKKVNRKEVVNELVEKMAEFLQPNAKRGYDKAITKWEKTKIGLLGAKASLRRVETWVDAMDRGNFNGAFRKYIWQPISDAATHYRDQRRQILEKYLEITKTIEKRITTDKIVSPELGYTFGENGSGMAELIGALLHTGNESNLQKLLRGRRWGEYREDGTLDTTRWDAFIARMWKEGVLTKVDYDFVQAIWDLNESLKPAAQKAHKDMYGYYFNEITAQEFNTPFGAYRGGYMPAIVDQFIADDAALRGDKEALEGQSNSFMFPTTGRGFTKTRKAGYARPLVMDLRFIPQHLDKVLRFIYIEPHVKDIGRLVIDQDFRNALTTYVDSEVASEMLVPWLQRSARQTVETASLTRTGRWADKLWKEIRSRTGLQIMTLNVTNALQQFTGLSISALKVKPSFLAPALWRYTRSPFETADMVAERSEFMRNRVTTQVMEVQEKIDNILLNPTKLEKARDFATKHGYFMQAGTQHVVDLITWIGAYDQAVSNGEDEKTAVRQADSTVRETQGTFAPEDISRFETGRPFMRAFTMFYTYFNMQANLLGTEFTKAMERGGFGGAGRGLYVYVFGFMIPAVFAEFIVQALSGAAFDDDDDDGYWDNLFSIFFGGQVRTVIAMVPGVGPAIQSGINAFNDKWYDDRITGSPAITMIESSVRAPYSIYRAIEEEGSDKRAIKDTLTAVGMATGITVAPLGRPLGYLADINQGKTEPENELDFARGLVTGKSQ